jgi:hypothetical protein
MMENDELAAVAKRYLDLWVEHWSSSLASPETNALLARVFGLSASSGGADECTGAHSPRAEPAAISAAHDAGDERARELEERVAGLERRLAELERAVQTPSAPGDGALYSEG